MVKRRFGRVLGLVCAMAVSVAALVVPAQAAAGSVKPDVQAAQVMRPAPQPAPPLGRPGEVQASSPTRLTLPSSDVKPAAVNCYVGADGPFTNGFTVTGRHFTQCDYRVRYMGIKVWLWKYRPAMGDWVVVGRNSNWWGGVYQQEVWAASGGMINNKPKYYTTTAIHEVELYNGEYAYADVRGRTVQFAVNVPRI